MRDEDGGLAELPAPSHRKRLFLVLDCERYRMARLHIFEFGPEIDPEIQDRFEREMNALSRLKHSRLNPILSYGQDDTELYYVDPVIDGESLRDYLRRTGPMAPAVALGITLQLIETLSCRRVLPRALENFSTGDLFLESNHENALSLVFCDFSGWERDDVATPSDLVARVALAIYSMLAGEIFDKAPYLPFTEEAFDTPEPLRNLIKAGLHQKEGDPRSQNLGEFESAARQTSKLLEDAPPAPAPQTLIRSWLTKGEDSIDLGPSYRELDGQAGKGSVIRSEFSYAVDAEPTETVSFNGTRFQLFPGEESVPREGWLDQHRFALSHPGRGMSNQLGVRVILPRGRCALIGEERIDGLHLESIVEQHGPLEVRHALEFANKLNSALDSIEKIVRSSPIWWLPPENTYVVTGPGEISALHEAINRYGTRAWHHLPIRLRLHQTMPALLKGIDLPDSLLQRMNARIKNGDSARRSAVLLPLFWFGITGRRLRWDRTLEKVDGVPGEIIEILEGTRRRLVESPSSENGRLLDRIASELAGEPIPAFLFPSLSEPIESVGIIVDSSVADRTAVAPPSRVKALDAAIAALIARSPKIDPLPLPQGSPFLETAAANQETEAEIENIDPDEAAVSPDETPDFRLTDLARKMPEPVEDDGEIESLGLIEDESVRGVDDEGQPLSDTATSDHDDTDSEPSSVEVSPEPEESDDLSSEGFGQRLLNSKPLPDPEPQTKPESSIGKESSWPWSKVILIAVGIGGVILGGSWMIGTVSSWANRQALSEETFQSTLYPAMKTTRAGDPSANSQMPPFTEITSDSPISVSSKAEQVTIASEAIRMGDQSRDSGQFSAAVGFYLRALELEPASSEARSLLSHTLKTWSEENGQPILSHESTADPTSQAAPFLAEYYRNRDPALHREWLTRSASGGYAPHQREMGLILSRSPHEMVAAAEWFRKAADQDDSKSQFHYGECLVFGKGVPRNVNLAIDRYLARAAAAGDGRAMELLGVCFAKGDGVNADPARALEFFRQAVEAGNVEAHYNLAVRFAKGDGVSKNENEAARIFHEGAEQGDAACMYAYGRCLEIGFGVSRDLVAAADWIRKSALLDFEDARAWCGLNGILVKTGG